MDEYEVETVREREVYKIQLKLPGVARQDLSLEVTDAGFCVVIGDNSRCFTLSHTVDVEEARAAFDGETLYLEMPIKSPIHGRRLEIEQGCLDMGEGNHRCI